MKRRLVYAFLTAIILIGGGTLGWYYLANQIHTQVNSQVDRLALEGKVLRCDNQQVKGYPFRVGLFCDKVIYEDKAQNTLISTGNLRTAAQFYQPGFIVGELDGPTVIKTPGLADMTLDWRLARLSTRLSLGGFKRLSLEFSDVVSTGLAGITKDVKLAEIASLQFHARAGGGDPVSDDLELVLSGDGVHFISALGDNNPIFNINIDGVAYGLNQAMKEGQDLRQWAKAKGVKLQIHRLELAMKNGGRLVGSGPVQIGRDGMVDGDLDVAVSDIQTMVDNFTAQNPQLGDTAKTIQTASLLFANSAQDGKIVMKIQIRKGVAMMGFIPLGVIPQLF